MGSGCSVLHLIIIIWGGVTLGHVVLQLGGTHFLEYLIMTWRQ